MKVYEIPRDAKRVEDLHCAERPEPKPGPYDVLVRLRAVALNYRDHAILTGKYRYNLDHSTIACSDGAGEVVAVGSAVTRFRPGDHVIPTFFQIWINGEPPKNRAALGAPLDGTLAEFVSLHEDGWVANGHGSGGGAVWNAGTSGGEEAEGISLPGDSRGAVDISVLP